MKASEFREMAVDELRAKTKELESSLFDMRLQTTMGKLQNVSQIRTTRREIARIRTVLSEKLSTTRGKQMEQPAPQEAKA